LNRYSEKSSANVRAKLPLEVLSIAGHDVQRIANDPRYGKPFKERIHALSRTRRQENKFIARWGDKAAKSNDGRATTGAAVMEAAQADVMKVGRDLPPSRALPRTGGEGEDGEGEEGATPGSHWAKMRERNDEAARKPGRDSWRDAMDSISKQLKGDDAGGEGAEAEDGVGELPHLRTASTVLEAAPEHDASGRVAESARPAEQRTSWQLPGNFLATVAESARPAEQRTSLRTSAMEEPRAGAASERRAEGSAPSRGGGLLSWIGGGLGGAAPAPADASLNA
jgi:hypothetical protein